MPESLDYALGALLTVASARERLRRLDERPLSAPVPADVAAALGKMRRDTEEAAADWHLWRAFVLACDEDEARIADVLATLLSEGPGFVLSHALIWWQRFHTLTKQAAL